MLNYCVFALESHTQEYIGEYYAIILHFQAL